MAILLDQYAEARIEALRKQTGLTKPRLVEAVSELVNEVNLALWTLPEARRKTVPLRGQAVSLEVTKQTLANLQRLLHDLASSGYNPEDIGRWIGSLRNAIQINLGGDWLPTA